MKILFALLVSQAFATNNPNDFNASNVAKYYALRRKIPLENLCPVALPPGPYATPNEFLGARKTAIEDCVCKLIPEGWRPKPCNETTLPRIRDLSAITHIVYTRGMPSRLTGTGWSSDQEDPSFD